MTNVCLSIWHFFQIFGTMVDNSNIENLMEPFFTGKLILTQMAPKQGFLDFLKNFVMLVFFGNNLRSKLILPLTFHHHIWQVLHFHFKLDDTVPRSGSTIKSSFLGTVGITFFRT